MGYIIAFYVVQGIIFGFITKHVAQSKGFDGGFAWGFFLGIIGLLVVGFRPSAIENVYQEEYKPMYGGRLQAEKQPSWTCICGSRNPGRLDYCPVCRRPRGEDSKDIKCPHCGAMNNYSRKICVLCDKPLNDLTSELNQPKISKGSTSLNSIEMLEKLAQLHERGILTDEEFFKKKEDILGKM